MKLIEEHLDIGTKIWTKEGSDYIHEDDSIPCTIIGFNKTKTAALIDNQLNGHSGSDRYYYDKKRNSLGNYNEKEISDRKYISLRDIERIAYPNLSKFIGRKVKLLVGKLIGGSVISGDIGIIKNSDTIDFPSHMNYCATNLFEKKDYWDKFELLPEDYKEAELKSDIKLDDKGRLLKEFVVGQWYTNPLKYGTRENYKYARVSECIIRSSTGNRYYYNSMQFDAFTTDFEDIVYDIECIANTNYDQEMELVIQPPAKKLKPILSNPFKTGDVVEFISLDQDSVPQEIWSRLGGIFNIENEYSLDTSYKVEGSSNEVSVILRGNKSTTYTIPVILLKKYEKRKYYDGTPIIDLKPGWYTNRTSKSSKKYVRIERIELITNTDGSTTQKVHYNAFTNDFINIESHSDYWSANTIHKLATPISDKEIEEIKKQNTKSSVKKYSDGSSLKEFKIGEWYKSPYNWIKTEMVDKSHALYVRVSKVIQYKNGSYYYNEVFFDKLTRDFIHYDNANTHDGIGNWANNEFDKRATYIDFKESCRIRERACRPKITEESGPSTGKFLIGFDPYIDNTEECRIQLKPWQEKYLEEVFDYTKIFKKEENLLDKYEHQVIKLTKPRTKNKFIIL